MENQVSPLLNLEQVVVHSNPILDDTYAYISSMDPLTRHDYHYILEKIEHGWITERDIEIAKFVFVHRWVTLSQISRLFFPDTERENTIRKRIGKMLKYGLLRKVRWTSYSRQTENRPSLYELGASGADILKYKFGTFIGQRDPRSPKQATMLFRMRYIITNELYIQLRSSFNLVHFEFHPVLNYMEEQQVPTATFTLKNPKGKKLSFFLICHREDEKWLKTVRFQAVFYSKYLMDIGKGNTLIILVSTSEKAEIANKILEQEGVKGAWFITDEDLYNDQKSLTDSFFTYQDQQKLYFDLN
ncbi:replication-relaxation family protein [Paenibacillus vini]|uniref:replication-relaxation family protein n=1 Tax=Paenibacillus vini TaxID=1476024 RepID=UPI0025B6443E|nr:replication-relaxation family protein [Paenibacillus vini]MDN4067565.1 replication-relaxation family protein [Paenibacillus vini]